MPNVPSIKGMKLNKGEWAEFYVLLKLLGEGRLYTADKLLRKNINNYLDIIKVIRQELSSDVINYIVNSQDKIVVIETQGRELAKIPMSAFARNATTLFEGIKDLKGNSVPAPDDVCDFAKIIYVSKPKAPSVKALRKLFGGKNDIFVEVRDGQTSIVSVMGFSIKSKFGQNPTLFNASSASNFIYEVTNCDDDRMKEFNDISDKKGRGWAKCRAYLEKNKMKLQSAEPQSSIYANNLLLVRESMSRMLAWCIEDRLIHSYSHFEVKETVERMAASNPLNIANPQIYYEKAVKDFLMAGFTGMTAGIAWDGKEQVSGGYIVVMEDGDVLCYHSADREAFRDYLYRNTRFEYVSTSKYGWGYIYENEGKYFLPLNISVRFNSHTR